MKKKLAAGIFAAVFFTMFATVTVWAEKSTVLEQVIYDENNIKVSVSEASLDAEQNIVIPLHIENNTDEKMGLIAENCYINGCKVEANSLFFDKAEPGGETDGLLVVSKQECDGYGIDRSLLNNKFKPFFQSEKVYDPDIKHSTTHGKNGVGRLTFFHFFQRLQNGIPFMSMITKKFSYTISVDSNSLNEFNPTPEEETSYPVGTSVSFFNIFGDELSIDTIKRIFGKRILLVFRTS